MNKHDLRYVLTEEKIIAEFYNLLKKKSFAEIKTKEIIAAAQINKSTFYNHYLDKYDLLDKIEDELLDGLYERTFNLPNDIIFDSSAVGKLQEYYYYLAEDIYKQREKLQLLIAAEAYKGISRKIAEHIKEVWLEKSFPGVSEPKSIYYIAALAGMISSVIGKWLENDCLESPQELAVLMQTLGDGVRKAIINKK